MEIEKQKEGRKRRKRRIKRRSKEALVAHFRNSAGAMVDKRKRANKRACRGRVEVRYEL